MAPPPVLVLLETPCHDQTRPPCTGPLNSPYIDVEAGVHNHPRFHPLDEETVERFAPDFERNPSRPTITPDNPTLTWEQPTTLGAAAVSAKEIGFELILMYSDESVKDAL